MTIFRINIDNVDRFWIRLAKLLTPYVFYQWIPAALVYVVTSSVIVSVIVFAVTILLGLQTLYPAAKTVLFDISVYGENIEIQYQDKDKRITHNSKISDVEFVMIKKWAHTSLTPYGLPRLKIKIKDKQIVQFSLDNWLLIWDSDKIESVYEKLMKIKASKLGVEESASR